MFNRRETAFFVGGPPCFRVLLLCKGASNICVGLNNEDEYRL